MGLFAVGCASGGYAVMQFVSDQLAVRVRCRRWTCPYCAKINRLMFESLIADGISMLGPCWLITCTLRLEKETVNAVYVKAVWARFWSRLQKRWPLRYSQGRAQWVKVVELTEKGQPHLHLVMSVPMKKAPGGQIELSHDRVGGLGLAREFRDDWHTASGGSFVVDARPAWGPRAGAHYLAKYFEKQWEKRKELERLGFARRYSRSQGWPKLSYKLKGHPEAGMYYNAWHDPPSEEVLENSLKDDRASLVGSTMGEELLEKRRLKKAYKLIGGLVNVTDSPADV